VSLQGRDNLRSCEIKPGFPLVLYTAHLADRDFSDSMVWSYRSSALSSKSVESSSMADSDEEIERAPTPDAAFYERTLNPELLVFYDSYESSSQTQHQKPHIPVKKGTIYFSVLQNRCDLERRFC
jgi:hypothetical protein